MAHGRARNWRNNYWTCVPKELENINHTGHNEIFSTNKQNINIQKIGSNIMNMIKTQKTKLKVRRTFLKKGT